MYIGRHSSWYFRVARPLDHTESRGWHFDIQHGRGWLVRQPDAGVPGRNWRAVCRTGDSIVRTGHVVAVGTFASLIQWSCPDALRPSEYDRLHQWLLDWIRSMGRDPVVICTIPLNATKTMTRQLAKDTQSGRGWTGPSKADKDRKRWLPGVGQHRLVPHRTLPTSDRYHRR